MTKRSIPGTGKTRLMGLSVNERDDVNGSRFRGLHQGQRSCEPLSKAGHMTAPDQICRHRQKTPCHAGVVHTCSALVGGPANCFDPLHQREAPPERG